MFGKKWEKAPKSDKKSTKAEFEDENQHSKILFKLLGTKPQTETEQDQRSIAGPNSNTIQSVRVKK